MAKNFTQFQEISGTADNTSGVREHNLPDTVNKDTAYVVGYVSDDPGGEARFSLRSILLTCDQVDIGLHNVTNESKETMFTSPTFTGETITIEGDLQVNGSVTSTGATTTPGPLSRSAIMSPQGSISILCPQVCLVAECCPP